MKLEDAIQELDACGLCSCVECEAIRTLVLYGKRFLALRDISPETFEVMKQSGSLEETLDDIIRFKERRSENYTVS